MYIKKWGIQEILDKHLFIYFIGFLPRPARPKIYSGQKIPSKILLWTKYRTRKPGEDLLCLQHTQKVWVGKAVFTTKECPLLK